MMILPCEEPPRRDAKASAASVGVRGRFPSGTVSPPFWARAKLSKIKSGKRAPNGFPPCTKAPGAEGLGFSLIMFKLEPLIGFLMIWSGLTGRTGRGTATGLFVDATCLVGLELVKLGRKLSADTKCCGSCGLWLPESTLIKWRLDVDDVSRVGTCCDVDAPPVGVWLSLPNIFIVGFGGITP